MEYLLLIYGDEARWGELTKEQQEQGVAAFRAYAEALKKAGVWKGGNRLRPVNTATTLRNGSNGKLQVQDGPFADSKEQLAGYYLFEAADMDAALSWASKCPGVGYGAVEVRPIWAPGQAASGN